MQVTRSFLGADGIGEQIERRLWRQGITRWDVFEPCKGIGPTRRERIESFISEGRAALERTNPDFFAQRFPGAARWRLYESFRDTACFFDIETTGLDPEYSVVTTVTLHQAGQTQTLVRGDDLTAERLRAVFADAGLVVTFNGARFDIPFLEQRFDITIEHPHIDLLPTTRRLGLSGGLSAVEQSFGIDRELPDVDGREAVRLWREHTRGKDGALERLVAYNREDTENMVPVMEQAVAALDEQVFPDGRP